MVGLCQVFKGKTIFIFILIRALHGDSESSPLPKFNSFSRNLMCLTLPFSSQSDNFRLGTGTAGILRKPLDLIVWPNYGGKFLSTLP
jgi:hypothetical protein